MRFTQEIIAAITTLEDRKGKLTASQVLEVARSPDSPLHPYFEWDDSIAAEQWRLEQARELIRRVKIVVEIDEVEFKTMRYMPDVDIPHNQQGYISAPKITKRSVPQTLAAELDSARALLERSRLFAATRSDALPAGTVGRIEDLISQTTTLINDLT